MKVSIVILAAGLGTRMKSRKPKVLHEVLGKPMIHRILETVKHLRPERIITVLNPHHEDVRRAVLPFDVEIAVQKRMLGTADAVRTGFRKLSGYNGAVLILNGDAPLVKTRTLKTFLASHKKGKSDLSVLSFIADNPSGYGRVVRNLNGEPLRIVEENELSGSQSGIREVNSGVYAINKGLEPFLRRIQPNPAKGEFYLTHILEIACKNKAKCKVFSMGTEEEFWGVNSMADLAKVEQILRTEVVSGHMKNGVRFLVPDKVIVHPDVQIAQDVLIYPNVIIEGETVIGSGTIIHQGTRIVNSILGENVTVRDQSLIDSAKIGNYSIIGPFAHLRPGTVTGKSVRIGNFVEVKKSFISEGTKASHLTYLGDATVGRNVNIGAGTITCNYDGVRKHETMISDGVFIGSDSQIVAPVVIGKEAFIAAGSTITKDVSPGALAISRVQQHEIGGWARKRRSKK